MRRLLASSAVLLFLFGGASLTYAKTAAQCAAEGLDPASVEYQLCLNDTGASTGDNSADIMAQINQQNADKTPTNPPAMPENSGILAGVMAWIASLFAWLVTAAMIALNYAVYYTVIKMGVYVNNLSAIGVTWRILRDIGNIMLIFGFLASGIMVILDTNQYGFGSKMLPKLLLAAIFINFSLFFAEAIVDTGNLFATQFYTQINGGQAPSAQNLTTEGISGKIMQQLGITKIYTDVRNDPNALKAQNSIFVGFMSIILFIVLAFVLFSLAFMFIARFVVLIVLIIVAPIGFAGWAIPKMQGIASKWWGTLVEQTITAPVLLLLLYIALAVITDAQFLSFGGDPNWLGLASGSLNVAGFAAVLLSFLVAMGLLLVVLTVAKSLSAAGAGWATKTAGTLTFGTTAWLGRQTAGRGFARASDAWKKSPLARTAIVGRGVSTMLDRGAKGTFDLRASTAGGAALKRANVDAGAAAKGGFKGWEEEMVKTRTKYAEGLKQTPEEKAAEEAAKKAQEEEKKQMTTLRASQRVEAEVKRKEHAEDLRPFDDKIADVQKRLAQMQRDRQMGGTVSDQEMQAAQTELETARRERREKSDSQSADLKALEIKHAANIEAQQKKIKDQEKAELAAHNAPQLGFAENITDNSPFGFFKFNKEAAQKIRDAAKKSKEDKNFENIKKMIEKAEKEGAGGEEKKEEKKEGGEAAKPADDHH